MTRFQQKKIAFMNIARSLASLSTCKRSQVGAIILPQDFSQILSVGYNGQPTNISNELCNQFEGKCGCVHAEANALIKLRTELSGLWLFSSLSPCIHCTGLIINSRRISKVFYDVLYRDLSGLDLLAKANIEVEKV